MWRFCNIPRYQTFYTAVAVLKEVHYWKPFVGPLIWSLALLADSWLRLWRQLWQQRRCRDLGRSGSSASPSPGGHVWCHTVAFLLGCRTSRGTMTVWCDTMAGMEGKRFTVPSFFPSALSSSTPAQIPGDDRVVILISNKNYLAASYWDLKN